MNLSDEVYELQTDIAALFFNIRSILDSMSTLMHFLYGPTSRQFSSFADYVKYIRKEQHSSGEIADSQMKDFINKNMSWFFLLRDIRDYITHYSSIDISFKEKDGGVLNIFIQNNFDLDELIKLVSEGMNRLIHFFDEHFSQLVLRKNQSQS